MMTNTMITMMVRRRASGQVGQETLRNSPVVSRKKRWMRILALWFFVFTSHVELLLI